MYRSARRPETTVVDNAVAFLKCPCISKLHRSEAYGLLMGVKWMARQIGGLTDHTFDVYFLDDVCLFAFVHSSSNDIFSAAV